MTFYVILKKYPDGWYPLDYPPGHYLDMKKKMFELRKKDPNGKYRLIKTSY